MADAIAHSSSGAYELYLFNYEFVDGQHTCDCHIVIGGDNYTDYEEGEPKILKTSSYRPGWRRSVLSSSYKITLVNPGSKLENILVAGWHS